MLIATLKTNQSILEKVKLTERELKKLGLPDGETDNKKIASKVMANALFDAYENVTSVFFVDTLNQTLAGIWEICR